MKILFMTLVAILVVMSGIIACARPAPTSTTPIKLVYASGTSKGSAASQAIDMACNRIEEITGGRIKIDRFYGGTLVKAAEVYPAIVEGAVDFTQIGYGLYPGRFPLTDVLDLPPTFASGKDAAKMTEFFMQHLNDKEEWAEVKVFLVTPCPAVELMTKKEIRTPADLKGLRIWGYSPSIHAALQAWGATPQTLPFGEIYDAIDKGVLDGVYAARFGLKSLKWGEVCNYSTVVGVQMAGSIIGMGAKKYNALPKDVRQVLDEVLGEWLLPVMASKYDEADIEGGKFLEQQGGKVILLSPEDQAAFRKSAMAAINDKWVKDMEAKGLPGKKILEAKYKFLKQYIPETFR